MLARMTLVGLFTLFALHLLFVEQMWASENSITIFEATVSGTKIKAIASTRPFDPTKHEIVDQENKKPGEMRIATIDGRRVVGTDQTVPPKDTPQLSQVTVFFGQKKIDVPESLMNNVFLPHLKEGSRFDTDFASTVVSVSSDGKCLIVDIGVGDGGGSSHHSYTIHVSGKCIVGYPTRPEP